MKAMKLGLGALLPLALIACAAEKAETDVYEPPPSEEPEPDPPPSEPASCDDAMASHKMSLAQTNLIFLLDRSSSMHKTVSGKRTRWTATRRGLFNILDTLTSDTWGGLSVFPAGDEPRACCVWQSTDHTMDCSSCTKADRPSSEVRCDPLTYTDIPTGMAPLSPSHVELIKDTVREDNRLNYWGTPMAAALDGVIDGMSAGNLSGVTSIVLLTDGLPGACSTANDPGANDLSRVFDAATAGQSVGIRTFVVGIDADGIGHGEPEGSLAVNLSPIAEAGGTARYAGCEQDNDCAYMVDVTDFEQSLDAALHQVALQATGCAFDMPQVTGGSANLDETTVSMVIGPAVTDVPRDTSHVNGWDALPNGQQLQLYGAACDQLKANPDSTVEIVVGCDPL